MVTGSFIQGLQATPQQRDEYVCADCFDDEDISSMVESTAESNKCDFCGKKSRKGPIAASVDAVAEFMLEAINREYSLAVEVLPYESAEGGYQGQHFDSYDLLNEHIELLLPNDDGRLLQTLANCLGDEPWCKDPFRVRRDEELLFSWERFCRFIKYQRRYFFLQSWTDPYREYLTPSQLFGFVAAAAKEHELVKELPAGSLVHRARQQKRGEVFSTSYDFGPPPLQYATRSNRMSPAGIVMLYGSEDAKTAIAEIDDDPKLGIWVGTFRTTRPAMILDLTALPRRFRFFEVQQDSDSRDRYAIDFLHSFVNSLAKKIERVEREHVDYVPTQVVTEYFRTTFRHNGSPIDGIKYASAQRQEGKSLVLFAEQGDVVLHPADIEQLTRAHKIEPWEIKSLKETAWLELIRKRQVRAPA